MASPPPKGKLPAINTGAAMASPDRTLSMLARLQRIEEAKPRISKISWLNDVLVYRASILPVIIYPVLGFTIFAAAVAVADIWYNRTIAISNNVVPLLSVVVGLLLVFRNSTAYERYAEYVYISVYHLTLRGRKDFTSMIASSRSLARSIWVEVVPPPNSHWTAAQRRELTEKKRQVIRMIVGFVMATKHYLRSEGGVHHADLQGLLPASLVKFALSGSSPRPDSPGSDRGTVTGALECSSPRSFSGVHDEEREVGLPAGARVRPPLFTISSNATLVDSPEPSRFIRQRRPSTVKVLDERVPRVGSRSPPSRLSTMSERTPLIKAGVRQDHHHSSVDLAARAAGAASVEEVGLSGMVEVGLPLVISHEISRTLFRFRRQGYLEDIGPAGYNAKQAYVQSMIDQLGSMERIIQTPLPYMYTSHLKQCVTVYLLCLPFVLVESLGWKMIPIIAVTSFTLAGIEGLACLSEDPFGSDPSDLNLDLYCTELMVEIEAVLETLPEGDLDEEIVYRRSERQMQLDEEEDG